MNLVWQNLFSKCSVVSFANCGKSFMVIHFFWRHFMVIQKATSLENQMIQLNLSHCKISIKGRCQTSFGTRRQDLPGPDMCQLMKMSLSVRFQHCNELQPAHDPSPMLPTPAPWKGSLGRMLGTLGHQNRAMLCNESGRSLSFPPSVKAEK